MLKKWWPAKKSCAVARIAKSGFLKNEAFWDTDRKAVYLPKGKSFTKPRSISKATVFNNSKRIDTEPIYFSEAFKYKMGLVIAPLSMLEERKEE